MSRRRMTDRPTLSARWVWSDLASPLPATLLLAVWLAAWHNRLDPATRLAWVTAQAPPILFGAVMLVGFALIPGHGG
jgi:hypothetical protein